MGNAEKQKIEEMFEHLFYLLNDLDYMKEKNLNKIYDLGPQLERARNSLTLLHEVFNRMARKTSQFNMATKKLWLNSTSTIKIVSNEEWLKSMGIDTPVYQLSFGSGGCGPIDPNEKVIEEKVNE